MIASVRAVCHYRGAAARIARRAAPCQ